MGDTVYEQILHAVHQGHLVPGQRLHDSQLAAQLGVSRTPVREALIRLGELGVVEIAAARYTRVAVVDRAGTSHALVAWTSVYSTLVAEVVRGQVPPGTVVAMREAHDRFAAACARYDLTRMAVANNDFYDQLTGLSHNPVLVRCVHTTVHVIRLGLLNLGREQRLNPEPLRRAQAALLAAVVSGDHRAAREAVLAVGLISF